MVKPGGGGYSNLLQLEGGREERKERREGLRNVALAAGWLASLRMRYHSLVLWWVVCHVSVPVQYCNCTHSIYIYSAEPILCRVDTVGWSVSAGAYKCAVPTHLLGEPAYTPSTQGRDGYMTDR